MRVLSYVMSESGGDEHPKFVITPRKCKLPCELLMAAMSPPQRTSLHSATPYWSNCSASLAHAQSIVKQKQGSPRERRMRAQLVSLGSSGTSLEQVTNARAHEFPTEWGSPPSKLSPLKAKLPEGYGVGSVTIRSWIIHRMHDVPKTSLAEMCASEAVAEPSETSSDNAAVARIDAFTRQTLRHPDVPWAPDGSTWSSFKMKLDRAREERRQRREAAVSSSAQIRPCGYDVSPIIPCLLLENIPALVVQPQQNRPCTPLSTRQLQRQLQHMKSGRDVAPDGCESQPALLPAGEWRGPCASRQPSASTQSLREVQMRPGLLAPGAHDASSMQRLLHLSSLEQRLRQVCALSVEEKTKAAILIAQRAKVVLELRRYRSQVQVQEARHQALGRLRPKAEHEVATRQALSQMQRAAHSLRDCERANVAVTRQKNGQNSRARSTEASRQRLWIIAAVQCTAISLFQKIVMTEKIRQVEAQKCQLAALTIQKVFRKKLIPYYARELVKAVAKLKPWMADALLRWRQRRLHRSADILRNVLLSSRQSDKIFSCSRAFKQKVVRIQRIIRAFLSCTQARAVRLLKLLHVQVRIVR
jgi:hypothetical protein